MAARRTERIVNLTICLLAAPRFLTREQIRAAVEGYEGLNDTNFERTFERDKDELRRLGVPIEVGQNSSFDEEVGYRISRADFELPPVEFSAEEAAVVSVAARAWQQANLSQATQTAMTKLRAAGLAPDTEGLAMSPTVGAREPSFEALYQAVVSTTRVRFDYRRPDGHTSTREVEPWGIVSHQGSWYLVGHDRDRGESRMFKLARVSSEVTLLGRPGAYQVPEVDLRDLVVRQRSGTRRTARLLVRREAAPWLRRRAESISATADPGEDEVLVSFVDAEDFAAELAILGPDVLVREPEDLRQQLITQLTGVLEAGR